jgi:hypothetical protein
VTEPVDVDGEAVNHSIPACFDELTFSPVSSAPQSFPFTHVTCCMRLSFESRPDDLSANGSFSPSRASEHGLLFRQSRSGRKRDHRREVGTAEHRRPRKSPEPKRPGLHALERT